MTSGETSGITAAASAVPETRKERLESSHSDTLINWRDNSAEHDVDYGQSCGDNSALCVCVGGWGGVGVGGCQFVCTTFAQTITTTMKCRQRHTVASRRVFFAGLESEPFIVFDPDDPQQTQLLVTVSERYVLEKDLDGELTELLDLKCLQVASCYKSVPSIRKMHLRASCCGVRCRLGCVGTASSSVPGRCVLTQHISDADEHGRNGVFGCYGRHACRVACDQTHV